MAQTGGEVAIDFHGIRECFSFSRSLWPVDVTVNGFQLNL